MEDFDFHSLLRKDLQALCKLNKIPANITNVAMADSLQALHQVVGLDELLQTLTSDPPRSPGKTVAGTPAVSQSARRGSVRRNPSAVVEPQTLTRTRRTAKKAAAPEAGGCPLQTPATAVSRRKVSVTETSKFDLEAGEDVSSVQMAYSTRRSVRLLGKSMGKMCLKETEVPQIEGAAAAGADSSIVVNETSEKTNDSCRNLNSSMENETDIKDGVYANDVSNSLIKEISDETNESCQNVDSLMKNETNDESNNLNDVRILDSQDKENSDEVDLPKADDTENVAADLTHVTDENMVESSNVDASIVYNSMDTETEMSHEFTDKNIGSNAEMETGSYPLDSSAESSEQGLIVEQQEAIVESEPAVPTPIRPVLRSIVVMGSNSHHHHTPAPQVIEGSSAAADTETESEGDVEDDNMEEVLSSAANQLQGQFAAAAPQVIEDSSAAAETETESDEKTSEGDNMEEVSSFTANQLQGQVEDAPSEIVINKENMIKKEELVKMSSRQLAKMLKEKLKLKEVVKTEKRRPLVENCNNGC